MKVKELISSAKRRGQAAFSMVEAVVGLGILATVGGALMTGITSGFFTMQMARENLRATQILLEKVETVRLCNWDQVTSTNNFIPQSFTNYYDPNSTNNRGLKYYGSMVVTNFPYSCHYATNMRQIVVTVNWKTGSMDRTRTYTTFVARDGLQNYVY